MPTTRRDQTTSSWPRARTAPGTDPEFKEKIPVAIQDQLMSVEQRQWDQFSDHTAPMLNPQTTLQGTTIRFHETMAQGAFVKANPNISFYRSEACRTHRRETAISYVGETNPLVLSVRESTIEDVWREVYVVPRHPAARRRVSTRRFQSEDAGIGCAAAYLFDKTLESVLTLSSEHHHHLRIHEAISGIAVFENEVQVRILGLRVGSMTVVGWIYCGFEHPDKGFIPCDLILTSALETFDDHARSSRGSGPEDAESSSEESSEAAVMRLLAQVDLAMENASDVRDFAPGTS
nr:hypothetical protein CFP56_66859 [Quercus suber]